MPNVFYIRRLVFKHMKMGAMEQRFILHVLVVFVAAIGLSSETECPSLWTTFDDSCYWFGTENPAPFVEAEHFCEQIGGHLVRVDSANENLFLKNFLRQNKHGDTWMGLSDIMVEGMWLWQVTMEPPVFTDWIPGEPNDLNNDEDCAHFFAIEDFRWNDTPCNRPMYPLCERTPEGIVVG